jgi:hypothetical protein
MHITDVTYISIPNIVHYRYTICTQYSKTILSLQNQNLFHINISIHSNIMQIINSCIFTVPKWRCHIFLTFSHVRKNNANTSTLKINLLRTLHNNNAYHKTQNFTYHVDVTQQKKTNWNISHNTMLSQSHNLLITNEDVSQ